MCTSEKKIHAKIILAGDPKQLDAVTRSDRAKELGFQTSWLEQLCATNLYSRNNPAGQYHEGFITQLVKNYRSHPQILKIPNELFYDNTLEPMAAQSNSLLFCLFFKFKHVFHYFDIFFFIFTEDINWYANSKFLPSKQFPMIFRAVQGTCQRLMEHSWFNNREVEEVTKVVKELLPHHASKKKGIRQITQKDIGIVTPYRKQRFKIQQKFRRLNLDEITVGTAETFQGKEKPVMIISTVRTDGELGFVNEPRVSVDIIN